MLYHSIKFWIVNCQQNMDYFNLEQCQKWKNLVTETNCEISSIMKNMKISFQLVQQFHSCIENRMIFFWKFYPLIISSEKLYNYKSRLKEFLSSLSQEMIIIKYNNFWLKSKNQKGLATQNTWLITACRIQNCLPSQNF